MDKVLIKELTRLLEGYSHMSFEEAVADFPMEQINTPPPNTSYTPWALLEHIRRTQADLMEYVFSKDYHYKSWPDDYWPPGDQKATPAAWNKTIKQIKQDREALIKLITDPKTNLFETVEENPDHTIFREILLAADHASYHIGEFATWRQIQKTWSKKHQ